MSLFKKRGKHQRSAREKSETIEAVSEVAAADAANDEQPSDEVKETAESDLNKPLSIDDAQSGADEQAQSSDVSSDEQQPVADSEPTIAIDPDEVSTKADDVTQSLAQDDLASQKASADEEATIGAADAQDEEDSNPFAGFDKEVGAGAYEVMSDAAGAGFVAAGIEVPQKRRRRGLKVFGITMGVIVIVLCAVYVVGAVVFLGRFLPNTTIGEYNISMKSDSEVTEMLEGIADDYQIDVVGSGFTYRASGSDIGLSINSAEIIAAMHDDLNAWTWPVLIFQQAHDETDQMKVSTKPASYESDVKAAVDKYNETATPPTNATIVYDQASSKFIVKEEAIGTQLDPNLVLAQMNQAIEALQPKLTIGAAELLQPTVFSTDEKLIESAELATGMVSAKITMVMGGQPVGEVNGETLSQFVTIDDKLDVTFKDEEMNAWVDGLAGGFNTVGTSRTYTRADGKAITVSGGVYGWEIDTEALKNSLIEAIKAGSTTQIEVPCISTAAVYSGAGQRDWGNRYVDVDISEQHARFYGDDGAIIWETDFISGSPDGMHNTVPGVWVVNGKESPSKLIGYENGKKIYETSVTYWMPFEGNGIGFHDATWQPGFGGSMYANGYGSHGCVNLSYSAAQELYGIIQYGDVVVVHD